MKVAIIGAGFTGLTAGIDLVKSCKVVKVFEANKEPGGLAIGFKPEGWNWPLEIFYHHIFTNDTAIINLAEEIGLPANFRRPITNSFIDGVEKQLDSPLSLLQFDKLNLWERVRMGMGLAFFKFLPNGAFLEKYKTYESLPKIIGEKGFELVWKPLLIAKFGEYAKEVNLAWFWARVYKRTSQLGYFEGGFLNLARKEAEYFKNLGGELFLGTEVKKIKKVAKGYEVEGEFFDRVIITSPAPVVNKLVDSKINWPKINYLWAQTVILELKQSLMKGYWLNILEKNWPFLVVVEHTNFENKKEYDDKVVVYLGNYLAEDDERLKFDDKKLIDLYLPYLQKINKNFTKDWISRYWRFKQPYSQPVFPTGYSAMIPPYKVDESLYVANMSMVYPWDRGTNYAVEMGHRVAEISK